MFSIARYVGVFSGGFTGHQCEIPPDYCADNECTNGATCIGGNTNYTCACAYGFKGQLCQTKAGTGYFLCEHLIYIWIQYCFEMCRRKFEH